MISVILSILKIIGIIILLLLGIILIILSAILFVPIRYKVSLEHGDDFKLDGGVSWLLHIIHGRFHHSEHKRRIWIRILGILVYDSSKPPRTKRVKPVKKSKTSARKTEEIKDIQVAESIPKTENPHEDEESSLSDIKTDEHSETIILKDEVPVKISDIKTEDKIESKGTLKSFFKRVKNKIAALFQRLKNKIKDLIQRFLNIKNKAGLIIDFLRDEINKEGFRFTLNSIMNIFKHIKPKRLKSRLIFGTGDPCLTGQVLGLLGILYSFYGEDLSITPDFENKVFKGNHQAIGRIRIWTILIIVIKLLLDKRFKELKMNYQLLKEAL